MRLTLLASIALLATIGTASAEEARPKQLVIISFDGAHDNALWDRSRKLAKKTGAHFTYFLSCTYLINPADRHAYKAPREKAGRSATGWAQSVPEIQARLNNIWQAHLDGHDIGSHACGHFDGKDWSEKDWNREFTAFHAALENAWKAGGIGNEEPQGWADFADNDIKGFRAPYLSLSDGLLPALKQHGFVYDASLVTKGPDWPASADAMPRFGLPLIPEGPSQRRVIGMDYNLFIRHSMGVENRKDSAVFEERTDVLRITCLLLIVAGSVGLKFSMQAD